MLTYAGAEYVGAVRSALLHYKERGRRDLAPALGELLGRAMRGVIASALTLEPDPAAGPIELSVVAVPSTRRAARQRGGDHVQRLARQAGSSKAPECVLAPSNTLRIIRKVEDSAGLDRAERRRNLAFAMQAVPPASPRTRAVLVDDIVTSGATIGEAYRALTAVGWDVIGAATVALTRPRTAPPRARESGEPDQLTLPTHQREQDARRRGSSSRVSNKQTR